MKSHPTDLVSFVPGVLCVAIAIVALAGGLTIDVLSADWLWPSVLIVLGLLVLATAGMGRRAPREVSEPAAAEAPTDDAGDVASGTAAWPDRDVTTEADADERDVTEADGGDRA